MAGNNFKIPPTFTEESCYEVWKNEIEMWKLVTDLAKKKQALAVALSLAGKPREVALEIPTSVLNAEDGVDKLIEKLDDVFLTEEHENSYVAYSSFENFKKEPDVNMCDFIIEFERRYNKTKKFNMMLPDPVLAFKLLDSCNLNNSEKQLALTAASDSSYSAMKGALRRVFGEKLCYSKPNDCIRIKQEPDSAYYTQQRRHNFKPRQQFNKFTQSTQRVNTLSSAKGKINPQNRYGKTSRCSVCQSIMHWRKDCPHDKAEVQVTEDYELQDTENCNLTLLTKEMPTEQEVLIIESLGAAVIDTACTRTVCGEKWFSNFVENVKDSDRNKLIINPSRKVFKFGDGKTVESCKTAIIPVKMGQKRCNIQTEVVDADIPLLLSKESLQKAGTVLDLKNDTAEMFGKPIQLDLTSSGHYCINILDDDSSDDKDREDIALMVTNELNGKEKKRIISKLHKQFGHASSERLRKLMESAGIDTSEIKTTLQEVLKECDICMKFKQPSPKPVVSLPMSSEFNETVSVDLHELEKGTWYLHIIDLFTRFSAGSIVRTKQASEFVKQFMAKWISVHGAPRKLFSDNGGEFNNEEVRDMAHNFNIEIKTTAGYSPWSNGLLERHNRTLTEILLKLRRDNRTDWETSLSWALMAKNSLHNVHGFSPFQLVFGRNPNLPSVLHDQLPALEGFTKNQSVAGHIAALYLARKAFTEAECSERIRRAIRKQTRPSGEKFVNGDHVYFKRIDSSEWKGPGIVIGQDGAVIFVRHGGTYVRVHQSRIQKIDKPSECKIEENRPSECEIDKTIQTQIKNGEIDSSDEKEPEEPEPEIVENNLVTSKGIKLKRGEKIEFRLEDDEETKTGVILGRAGKVNGPLKNWYNLQFCDSDEKLSMDLARVKDLKQIDNENNAEEIDNVMIVDDNTFDNAKRKELDSWMSNRVYEEVENKGQKFVTTRWVCTVKESKEGIVPKARLVARGFEDLDNGNILKDSPTCSTESLRTVLSVIAQKKWSVHTMDVKTAFLQGAELSREIFIKPPKEANFEGLWKLRKCVYGLADASLAWYKRVCEVMYELGAKKSKVDPAVFVWVVNGQVIGLLASHVDDFIWAGDSTFEEKVIEQIRKKFLIGNEENGHFSYVGIDIYEKNNRIDFEQHKYIDNLQSISLEKSRQKERNMPLNEKETDNLRSKIGQLLWVARQSRPDVLYDVCSLARNLKVATVEHLIEANKIVKRLKSEKVTLKYQHLGNDSSLKLVTFSDASLGNLPDGGTQGGGFIVLMGEQGLFSPLWWQSKRIRRVVKSTLAGETLALTEGIDNSVFIATLFTELYLGHTDPTWLPIVCITDNKSLCDAIRSHKAVTERRLRMEISSVKEMIENHQIQKILWSGTKDQLSDCLTKRGASSMELLRILENGTLDQNLDI